MNYMCIPKKYVFVPFLSAVLILNVLQMIKKYEGYKWWASIKPEWRENTLLTGISHQLNQHQKTKYCVLADKMSLKNRFKVISMGIKIISGF